VKSSRRFLVFVIALICLGAAIYFFRDSILYSMGAVLTRAEPPQKADIAVVLAGDLRGNRMLTAARLCQEGYVAKVLVSGPDGFYDAFESDMAIAYAVKHGYPADEFIGFDHWGSSTLAEARAVIPELRRRGVHNYLLVTSEYHTARAGRIFRREGRDLEEHTVAAPDPYWEHGYWWRNREGRKLWLYESLKTAGDYLGI
jgi:uncharacterized SAM-binding protein YcdF (DUF218 family)